MGNQMIDRAQRAVGTINRQQNFHGETFFLDRARQAHQAEESVYPEA
jgi:hypothetical protein